MGRSRDLFLRLLEEMMNHDPLEEALYQEQKKKRESGNYVPESYEITKGNYKTIVQILFNKEGYPVGVKLESELLQQEKKPEKDLQTQLSEALEKEDYELAAKIQKEMKEFNSLKEPTK